MNLDLQLVLKNSLRNRRRSMLTIASMAVSICLIGVLLALSRALFYGSDTTPGQAKRLIVHHKIALTQDLPVAYEQTITKIPGVQAVTRLRWFGGTYRDARDPKNRFAQFAIEPPTLFKVYPEFQIQESEKQAFISQKTACVASRPLAEKLGWKPGERITLVGGMSPTTLELTLVGSSTLRPTTRRFCISTGTISGTACQRVTPAGTWFSSSTSRLRTKMPSQALPKILMMRSRILPTRRKASPSRRSC
jgi:hypothetical protein